MSFATVTEFVLSPGSVRRLASPLISTGLGETVSMVSMCLVVSWLLADVACTSGLTSSVPCSFSSPTGKPRLVPIAEAEKACKSS